MSFFKGDLFHIETKNGIYQVLDVYSSDDKGCIYYFRKVFDGKLNIKISKAEFVHESWMRHIREKTLEKLSSTLDLPEVKALLNDLTIDRMMKFEINTMVSDQWYTISPKNLKRIENQLNNEIEDFLEPSLLNYSLKMLQDKGELLIESCPSYPRDGRRLYRLELGRYCDDFDKYGNKLYRKIRFYEIELYKYEKQ